MPAYSAKTNNLALKKELYPFQREGLALIEARKGRVLLADNMGLGKTVQSLAWLHLRPEKRPAVVICPAHLKFNWEIEVRETLPGKVNVQVINGTDTSQPLTGDIIIINYEILPNKYNAYKDSRGRKRYREIKNTGWVDFLLKLRPEVLIVDEAHKIKNNSAFRTKAVKKMARKVPTVMALTGTPFLNRPVEGFNIAQIVDKRIFPNYWTYVHRYCDAKHTGFGWDFSGASNKSELHQTLINTIMIRRKKSDVLKDLPNKIFSFVPMPMSAGGERNYKNAERDFIQYLQDNKGVRAATKAKKAEHLTKIEALKQMAVEGKMESVLKWVDSFLENSEDDKLVIFAIHKAAIKTIYDEYHNCAVKVDGSVSDKKRALAVEKFQSDPKIRLFIGNIQAAGTGLTLTAASSVAFIELPWTPGELVQAEDRCHRIGQKKAVNIYYLLAHRTIEEKIARLLDKKKKVLDEILDGGEGEDTKLITRLIRHYTERGPKRTRAKRL